jgi:Rnl2 family RNA ligase
MEFKKYASIENADRKEIIEKIKEQGFYDREYVVQEKVHGANVCFLSDGQEVVSAKRTGFISADEKFYNIETVQEKYTPKILMLYNIISERFEKISHIAVYGELFGGLYPHPEVKKNPEAVRLQKGIYYSPDNEFYAFDILINGNQYLDTDTINELFEATGIFYAKTLFRGPLEECLKYPNKFQSQISGWLHLPQFEDNVCEGVVIRPVEPCFFGNNARVMLKNKNEKWEEKSCQKKRKPLEKVEVKLSTAAQNLLNEASAYITNNRLHNVISKIGEVAQKDLGKLQGLLGKDALDDFLKDHKMEYQNLEKNEQKAVNKHLNTEASKLLKAYFKEA